MWGEAEVGMWVMEKECEERREDYVQLMCFHPL
jgi:hypothetical protein